MSKQEYIKMVERLFRTITHEYILRYRLDRDPQVLLDMLEKNMQAFNAIAKIEKDAS